MASLFKKKILKGGGGQLNSLAGKTWTENKRKIRDKLPEPST